MNLGLVQNDVFTTIRFFASNPEADEADLVEGLCSIGYERLHAELLVVFVPMGLSRALIRRFEVEEPTRLSDHVLVMKPGGVLEVPLARVPEFVEAQRLGEETFTTGIICREHFANVAQFSVE